MFILFLEFIISNMLLYKGMERLDVFMLVLKYDWNNLYYFKNWNGFLNVFYIFIIGIRIESMEIYNIYNLYK